MTALETSQLVPSSGFMMIGLTYFALAIAGPAVDAARQRRWLWVVAVVPFAPIAGLPWLALRVTRHDVTA